MANITSINVILITCVIIGIVKIWQNLMSDLNWQCYDSVVNGTLYNKKNGEIPSKDIIIASLIYFDNKLFFRSRINTHTLEPYNNDINNNIYQW